MVNPFNQSPYQWSILINQASSCRRPIACIQVSHWMCWRFMICCRTGHPRFQTCALVLTCTLPTSAIKKRLTTILYRYLLLPKLWDDFDDNQNDDVWKKLFLWAPACGSQILITVNICKTMSCNELGVVFQRCSSPTAASGTCSFHFRSHGASNRPMAVGHAISEVMPEVRLTWSFATTEAQDLWIWSGWCFQPSKKYRGFLK